MKPSLMAAMEYSDWFWANAGTDSDKKRSAIVIIFTKHPPVTCPVERGISQELYCHSPDRTIGGTPGSARQGPDSSLIRRISLSKRAMSSFPNFERKCSLTARS